MNKQLIERTIVSTSQECPEINYDIPLLDRNVAEALSKSFVKILKISNINSNTNNNLRLSMLENIRKMCLAEPEGHVRVEREFTSVLATVYKQHLQATAVQNIDEINVSLEAFLVRSLRETNFNSICETKVNAEVIQALINLKENDIFLDILSNDIIHWNTSTGKYFSLLKHIWRNDTIYLHDNILSDVAIKMKNDTEKLLLNFCHRILVDRETAVDAFFMLNTGLEDLVNKSAKSKICFQICSGILNYVFIMTNFDERLQLFISLFVQKVKDKCETYISTLYPMHLNPTVVLLDYDIDTLPMPLKNIYLKPALECLSSLHADSENDLILVLSHFPQWFNIYYEHKTKIT